jgi:hypothetical protein
MFCVSSQCVSLDRLVFDSSFDNLFPNGNVVESTDLCFIRDDWSLNSEKQHIESGTTQHYWFALRYIHCLKEVHKYLQNQKV